MIRLYERKNLTNFRRLRAAQFYTLDEEQLVKKLTITKRTCEHYRSRLEDEVGEEFKNYDWSDNYYYEHNNYDPTQTPYVIAYMEFFIQTFKQNLKGHTWKI